MRTQKFIAVLSGLLVLSLTIGGFILSYNAQRLLAFAYGVAESLSYVYPLVVDGAIIVFSMAILSAQLYGMSAKWPWTLVVVFTIVSVTFNIWHAPDNLRAKVIAVVPPIVILLAFETFTGQVRNAIARGKAANVARVSTAVANELSAVRSELSRVMEERNELLAKIDQLTEKATIAPNVAPPLESANQKRATKAAERRNEVLAMLKEGFSNAQIADKLGVAERTIDRDRKKLNGKVTA